MRVLKNKIVELWETEGGPILPFPVQIVLTQDLYNEAARSDMPGYMGPPAGQICGLSKEIKTARKIVEDMVNQAIDILKEDIPGRVEMGGIT
jgi:NAD(P)H-dependent flavin oxidoreductase YrpB (nitropropane dioxygenase family)